MSQPLTLALETSCDETSAALLRGRNELLAHTILSQDIHIVYGGVVPEIASREHLRTVDEVVATTLKAAGVELRDVDLFGVTAGPGLIGALLVGVAWVKGAAWALGKPVVGVHHMEGHLFAVELEEPRAHPPFVGLLVSGGHTLLLWVAKWGEYHLLGQTRDDAAGEAFDKAAKLLGLPYPGGPSIERAAADGDPSRHRLPRPLLSSTSRPGDPDYFDFSYSGLKTALRTRIREVEARGERAGEVPHLAAAFQDAAVDVLVAKTMRAVAHTGCDRVVLGGGVANSRLLRERLRAAIGTGEIFHPSPRLATDNAAMIARAARFRFEQGDVAGLDLNASAGMVFPGLERGGLEVSAISYQLSAISYQPRSSVIPAEAGIQSADSAWVQDVSGMRIYGARSQGEGCFSYRESRAAMGPGAAAASLACMSLGGDGLRGRVVDTGWESLPPIEGG